MTGAVAEVSIEVAANYQYRNAGNLGFHAHPRLEAASACRFPAPAGCDRGKCTVFSGKGEQTGRTKNIR